MKRLLLLGAGHAHLHVLAALARQRLVDVEVTLVEPNSHAVYSGMVPGVVAGHYAVSDCHIDWPPLLQAAAASGRLATATALDSAAQRVQLSDGGSLSYDLLSIDTGAVIERPDIPGADELAWPVRPMVDFLQRLELLRVQTERAAIDIVVIGGGAAGIELAMALQRRLQHSPRPGRTALVAGDGSLLAGHASGVRRLALAALRRWRISVIPEDCVAIEPG
jgi:NADH dehydrogenase FAD-containing subunit